MKIFKEHVSEAGERYWLSTFLLLLNSLSFNLGPNNKKAAEDIFSQSIEWHYGTWNWAAKLELL